MCPRWRQIPHLRRRQNGNDSMMRLCVHTSGAGPGCSRTLDEPPVARPRSPAQAANHCGGSGVTASVRTPCHAACFDSQRRPTARRAPRAWMRARNYLGCVSSVSLRTALGAPFSSLASPLRVQGSPQLEHTWLRPRRGARAGVARCASASAGRGCTLGARVRAGEGEEAAECGRWMDGWMERTS
jgi:hypothetical protein